MQGSEQETEERQTVLGEALAAARAAADAEASPPREEGVAAEEPERPRLDALGRVYATGKRKNAVARVWLKRGSGQVVVNGRPGPEYFARPVLQMIIGQPFQAVNRGAIFDVDRKSVV